ncbi:MAG: hypothetical protein KF777_22820 [Planctomycetaceae bacterium]|nr:hypothetical protein [Planctomycetaceae bacterium]
MPDATTERAKRKQDARKLLLAAQQEVNERLRMLDEGKSVEEVLAKASAEPNFNVACDSSC